MNLNIQNRTISAANQVQLNMEYDSKTFNLYDRDHQTHIPCTGRNGYKLFLENN